MKEPIEILEEIKKDFLLKSDNDLTIRRICSTVITEYKLRTK